MFMGYSSGKIPESWVLGFALTCVLMETIHLNTACQVALQLQVGCKSIASQLQVNSQNDSLNIKNFSYFYDNKFYFTFTTAGDVIACSVAYGNTISLPTSWTNLGTPPSNLGKVFDFISIPLVGGATIAVRYNTSAQSIQFMCSTSSAVYAQGSGAGRLR